MGCDTYDMGFFLAHQIEFSAFFTHFNEAYLVSYF